VSFVERYHELGLTDPLLITTLFLLSGKSTTGLPVAVPSFFGKGHELLL
jgi:hypothetical protein